MVLIPHPATMRASKDAITGARRSRNMFDAKLIMGLRPPGYARRPSLTSVCGGMQCVWRLAGAALLSLCLVLPLPAQRLLDEAPAAQRDIPAVTAHNGMVVAQETRAARIGVEFLRRGGNAIDAAVATGFA